MQPKARKKLQLTHETLRSLTLTHAELGKVVGGISGQRGCHSIQDRCPSPSGGVTCNSANNICPSGICEPESIHSICN